MYAPLSALSPFSAAALQGQGEVDVAAQPTGTASVVPTATVGGAAGKPYAPLSAFSPFSSAAVQHVEEVTATDTANTATNKAASGQVVQDKPYAPLSAFSPFSAATAQAGPECSSARHHTVIKSGANDSADGVGGSSGNGVQQPAAPDGEPQGEADIAGKPYAPLSAFSPFSGVAAVAWE